jgi:hypothetical protein
MPRKQEVVYAVTQAQQGFALVYRLYPYRFRTFCVALDVDLDIDSAALCIVAAKAISLSSFKKPAICTPVSLSGPADPAHPESHSGAFCGAYLSTKSFVMVDPAKQRAFTYPNDLRCVLARHAIP